MIFRLYGQNDSRELTENIKKTGKRIFDLVMGVSLLMVFLPVILIISLILIVKFGGAPFYLQKRGLALNKRLFTIIKFRTMAHAHPSEKNSTNFLMKNIPSQKIDKFCAWLRKTGLDELPQVFNVLMGDMSFVGPRPLSIHDLELIQSESPVLHSCRENLQSKPGITGYWQVFGDRSEGVENLIALDWRYEEKKSFLFDMFIIWKTIPVILLAHHSDAILGSKEFHRSSVKNIKTIGSDEVFAGWSNQ